jgi:aldehyde:ferredoxin oxidoreductase
MLNAKYGLSLKTDDVVTLGQSILKTEREFNKHAGFTQADDRLPEFFKNEALAPHNVKFDISDKDLDSVFNW